MQKLSNKFLFFIGLKKSSDATDIWYKQRLSSILIIPLSLIFFYPMLNLDNLKYSDVVYIYNKPFYMINSILFFLVAFKHMEQGFEVILEDYVSNLNLRKFLFKLNMFFCWSMCLIGISSAVWIYFS